MNEKCQHSDQRQTLSASCEGTRGWQFHGLLDTIRRVFGRKTGEQTPESSHMALLPQDLYVPSTTLLIQAFDLLRHRGLERTLQYLVHVPYERYWRWRLGIRTMRHVLLSEVGIENPLCHTHSLTHYCDFKKAMKGLNIRPDKDVFIDYGSGMGAAVVMAATFPFRKVIGVEISSEFCAVAERLVERNRGKLRCKDIQLVVKDAVSYTLPAEITVVYFYNPFRGSILAKVFENIRASLVRNPRELTIVFKNPTHLGEISGLEWLVERRRFTCYNGQECVVLEALAQGIPLNKTDSD
jgi:hypothetical protein